MDGLNWANLGVGVAAVAVNLYIVRAFIGFLSNHMSQNTQALIDLTVATQRLVDKVESAQAQAHEDAQTAEVGAKERFNMLTLTHPAGRDG